MERTDPPPSKHGCARSVCILKWYTAGPFFSLDPISVAKCWKTGIVPFTHRGRINAIFGNGSGNLERACNLLTRFLASFSALLSLPTLSNSMILFSYGARPHTSLIRSLTNFTRLFKAWNRKTNETCSGHCAHQ